MAERRSALVESGLFGVLVTSWGLNYLFVRSGLGLEPPVVLAFFRAGAGAVVLLAALAPGAGFRSLSGRDVRDALLIGVPNTAIFLALWFTAAVSVPPGQTAVLVYTFPLWVTLLAGPVLHERPTRGQLAAVVLGFAGVVLVSMPWSSGASSLRPLAVFELLGSAVSWALGTVLFKRRFQGAAIVPANAWQLAGGSLALGVAVVAVGAPVAATWSVVPIVLWLGVVGTAIAYTIFFRLLDRISAIAVSAYTFLVPLVALVGSYFVFGERLVVVQGVGVAAVLLAIYLNAAVGGPTRKANSTPGAEG